MFKNIQGARGSPAGVRRRKRGAAVALVVVALALLVLKPFCDFAFGGAGSGAIAAVASKSGAYGMAGHPGPAVPDSTGCCATISDETLIKPAEYFAPPAPGLSLGVALIALAGFAPAAGSRFPARHRPAAPPERSYYARSARILR